MAPCQPEPQLDRSDQKRRKPASQVRPKRVTPRPQVIVIGRIDGRVRTDESPQIPHSDDGHTDQECCEPSSRALRSGACSRNRSCLHILAATPRSARDAWRWSTGRRTAQRQRRCTLFCRACVNTTGHGSLQRLSGLGAAAPHRLSAFVSNSTSLPSKVRRVAKNSNPMLLWKADESGLEGFVFTSQHRNRILRRPTMRSSASYKAQPIPRPLCRAATATWSM